MPTAIIIHGALGSPSENWFPWLKKELEKLGYTVFVPAFPTPENQTLENWLKVFSQDEKLLDENSILVGHSLGSPFLLSAISRLKKPVKAAYLVAGFLHPLGIPQFDPILPTFLNCDFNFKKICGNCHKFIVFSSDNDPYVKAAQGSELADKLGAEFVLVKGAGHFNKSAGYEKFELLLSKIKEI